MPSLNIMTFNVENMLTRYNFRKWEKDRLAVLLDVDSEVERANLIRARWNALTDESRVFTALTIMEGDPEVICLQEVENMRALKWFHDRYLNRFAKRKYRWHMVLIEGNDPRGIDVAVMSRYKIASSTTHQDRLGDVHYPDGSKNERVFRRDCLEVHIEKHGKALPIFICHFKSMSGGRKETRPIRQAEAAEVKEILNERFNNNPAQNDWLVVGDLNDYTESDGTADNDHGLAPLLDNDFSVDLIKKSITQVEDRWTHYYGTEDNYHQLDYLLASPALAAKNPNAKPMIIRNGQPYRAERYQGARWPRVGYDRPKASDHCPVLVSLDYGT